MVNNVEEIKTRLNIVDVIGEYVRLTKAGSHWKGICPFHHEKSPSFMVNEEKQIYHCFGCSKGGDVFSFVQEIESLDFREVLKILAEKAGVQLEEFKGEARQKDEKRRILDALELATKFYETQLWKGAAKEKILAYLHERGLDDESIQKFRIGYAPNGWDNILKFLLEREYSLNEIAKTGLLVEKNNQSSVISHQSSANYYDRFRERIMFPVADAMGQVVGYSARVTPGQDESQAKYINTPESLVYHKSKVLYGLSFAKTEIKQKNYVLLVEGNMDVIAASQAGFANTVAVSGTALTPDQVTMLKRYSENIAMLFDMDSAGQLAASKSADLCLEKGMNVKVVSLEEVKDAAEAVQRDPNILLNAVKKSVPAIEYFFQETLRKYDRKSAEGKRNIVKDVLVHVAYLENPIEKAHWIKKIAHEIDTEEKVVADVLKNIAAKNINSAVQVSVVNEQKTTSFQKRSEVLRDTILGLTMQNPKIWQQLFESSLNSNWVKHDELFVFILQSGKEANFSFDQMLANIGDSAMIERLRKIYFNTELSFLPVAGTDNTQAQAREKIEEHVNQYVKELQKERLQGIIKEIEQAELRGDKENLKKLMEQFTKLSQAIK